MTTIPQDIPQKQCSKCKKFLPATLEYFHFYKDVLRPSCKECKKAYAALHKEERAVYQKEYRQSHKEESDAWHKAYRQTHREEIKAGHKAYHQTHKKEEYARGHNYRARKRNNGGSHTAQDIQAQYKRQKGRCYYAACGYCKLGKIYHVDHVIPLAKGGSNNPSNLVIACPMCNMSKHDKLPHQWFEGGKLL